MRPKRIVKGSPVRSSSHVKVFGSVVGNNAYATEDSTSLVKAFGSVVINNAYAYEKSTSPVKAFVSVVIANVYALKKSSRLMKRKRPQRFTRATTYSTKSTPQRCTANFSHCTALRAS